MTSPEIRQLSAQAASLLRTGQFPAAIEVHERLLSMAPDMPDIWYNLAYLQRHTGQFEAALVAYSEAIARGLNQPEEAHVNRAAILSEHLMRSEDAERELLAAINLAPDFLTAWHNLGQLREDYNDREGARAAYRQALRLNPGDGRAHARLAALDIFEGDAAAVVERLRKPLSEARLKTDAAQLEFAIANALDAIGDYDAAFLHFQRANTLGAATSLQRYDPEAQDRLIDGIIATFPEAIESSSPSPGPPTPLFICGMFRSGSTLCEQTLARHGRVTAAGELELIPALAQVVLADALGNNSPVDNDSCGAQRDFYLKGLIRLFPDGEIITDKRPDNFLNIGFIKAMFPAATIIHTIRNPIDTILSVFFLYFTDNVAYSSSLDDIVHYFRGHQRLMAHWQRLYPDIVTFDYDGFVASPLSEAKALISACGLEWEASCNPMQAVTKEIRTASAWQVRQPIHTRSAGRWKNYAQHIPQLVALFQDN